MPRDYILRMIEEFGRFAVALRRMILGGDKGSEEVGIRLRSLASQAGLDLDVAHAATLETLLLLAAPSGELDPARCWMYAETLYLDGLDASLTGDHPRAQSSLEKARRLFELVAPQGAFLVGFPEAGERIEEIEAELRSLQGDGDGRARRRARVRRFGRSRPAGDRVEGDRDVAAQVMLEGARQPPSRRSRVSAG